MSNRTNPARTYAYLRLAWLERFAARQGAINRSDLQAAFGISAAQASADLAACRPARNLQYNLTDKTYYWKGRGFSCSLEPLRPILSELQLT